MLFFPGGCVFFLPPVPGTASAPSVDPPSSPPGRCQADPSACSSPSAGPSTPTPPWSRARIGGTLHCSGWWTGPRTCGRPPLSAAPVEATGEVIKTASPCGKLFIMTASRERGQTDWLQGGVSQHTCSKRAGRAIVECVCVCVCARVSEIGHYEQGQCRQSVFHVQFLNVCCSRTDN